MNCMGNGERKQEKGGGVGVRAERGRDPDVTSKRWWVRQQVCDVIWQKDLLAAHKQPLSGIGRAIACACVCVCVRKNRVAEASKCVILQYWSMFLPLHSAATSRKWFLSNLACLPAEKGFCRCSVSSHHVWFIKLEFNELSDHGRPPPLLESKPGCILKVADESSPKHTFIGLGIFSPSTTRGSADLFPT